MSSSYKVLVVLLLLFGSAQISVSEDDAASIRYRVVDVDDQNKGMESKIIVIDLAEKFVPISATDEDGYFDLKDIQCQKGEAVQFVPKNELYYPYRTRCPFKGAIVRVGRIQYVHNLAGQFRVAVRNKDYGTAALLSNEVATRTSAFDPQTAAKITSVTYQYAAFALGVHTDYRMGRTSPEFVGAVKKFQVYKGLDSSGELDYATLRALADKDINAYIFQSTEKSTVPRTVEAIRKQVESMACDPECQR